MTVGIGIRDATIADSEGIAQLVTDLGYRTSPGQMCKRLEAILHDEDYNTLVAWEGERVVGFIGTRLEPLYESDDLYGQIMALAVATEWIKMLGQRHGIRVPKRVSLPTVTRKELLPALAQSSRGIVELLALGISHGGKIPASGVAWLNLPVDVVHVLADFVAHEGHHRGQIVMLARQTGHRLPSEISAGLWQWSKRAKEAQAHRG